MLRIVVLFTALTCSSGAQEGLSPALRPVASRAWKLSLAAVAAAHAADIHSSWGKHELNAALSGSSGRFGAGGAVTKLGMASGLAAAQCAMLKGRGSRYRGILTVVNFSAAAAIAGVAAHNYTIARLPAVDARLLYRPR
jgi:hypothetical protein